MQNNLNVAWLKCRHGIEKRNPCVECEKEKNASVFRLWQKNVESTKKIPIRRGCHAIGGCFCDGSCQEIIGYRDPIFEGETY